MPSGHSKSPAQGRLIETWDVLKLVDRFIKRKIGNRLIETWDVLKSDKICDKIKRCLRLIETWDVLKSSISSGSESIS